MARESEQTTVAAADESTSSGNRSGASRPACASSASRAAARKRWRAGSIVPSESMVVRGHGRTSTSRSSAHAVSRTRRQ